MAPTEITTKSPTKREMYVTIFANNGGNDRCFWVAGGCGGDVGGCGNRKSYKSFSPYSERSSIHAIRMPTRSSDSQRSDVLSGLPGAQLFFAN